MRDVLPDTPGLKEGWGKGIFWCPWCDGYEHRDQSFGILGNLSDVLGSVLEVNTQFSDIIAFVNGTQTPAGEAQATASHEDWREQLKAWNIKIENRTIASIERLQDGETHQNKTADMQFDKFLVHFTTGEPIERNAFITNFAAVQRSSLPYQMQLNVTKEKINVDASGMRTNVTGVYAVGDANSDGSTNVPHAMFSGKKAAVYLHGMLSSHVHFILTIR
jgi:thioredoxin reductase